MKPVLLRMRNIGPFLDETLDFTRLGSMFLINGSTGAGKTTIFDAMTYALYGTFSGDRATSADNIRSRYAPSSEEAFSEFTFLLAGRYYRVRRTLPQEYIKRTGSAGKHMETASLESSPDGILYTPYTGSLSETDEKIRNIIGLDASDFSRIVLLPQGAFAEFLREKSAQRRDTLLKLFPVDSYSGITAEVKELAAENERKLADIHARITGNAGKFDAASAEKDLADIRKHEAELRKKMKDLQKKFSSASAEKERLNTLLASSLKKESDRAKLAELQKHQSETAEKQKLIENDSEAQKLSAYIKEADRTSAAKERTEADLRTASEAEKAALEANRILISRKDAEEKAKADADAAAVQLPQEKMRLSRLSKLALLRKNAASLLAKQNNARLSYENLHHASSDLLDSIRKEAVSVLRPVQEDVLPQELLSRLADVRSEARDRVSEAGQSLKNARIREKLAAEKAAADRETETCRKAAEAAQKQFDTTQKMLAEYQTKLEQQKRNSAACSLLSVLEEGKPCPVCGSLVHPAPVQPLFETVSLEECIEAEKKNSERCSADLLQSNRMYAASQKSAEEKQKQLDEADDAPSADEAQQTYEALSAEYERVSEAYTSAASYDAQYAASVKQETEAREILSKAQNDSSVAQAEAAQLEETIRNGSAEPLPDAEELSARITQMEQQAEHAQQEYASWLASLSSSEKLVSSSHARTSSLAQQLSLNEQEYTAAHEELAAHVSSSPFASADEASKALLSEDERKTTQNDIAVYIETLSKLSAVIENAPETESSDTVRNQIAAAEQNEENIRKDLDDVSEDMQQTASRENALDSFIRESADLEKERIMLEEQNRPYRMLCDDLTGANPKKTPFDTWALGMYFEQIVRYASDRFRDISGGRYTFRIFTDNTAGNGYKGLDLLVTDSYTGSDRDPATLSGGETFMASISLALALTDIVQSRNGGIQLDSLFIDEGFGSLDEDSLDCALSILNSLQETKTVGVISHVESMKTAIPSQVEVVKSAQGSRIRIKQQ
jgi:exonuclease SbcC